MDQVDLRKQLRHLYSPSAKRPEVVDVPALNFLTLSGTGSPDAPEFQAAVAAIYAVAFDLRFSLKRERGLDSPVMPLEGLWWTLAPLTSNAEIVGDKRGWHWTLMIAEPDAVTAEDVASAKTRAAHRLPATPLADLGYERFEEGLAVQVMHIGPYSAELPTIDRLHAFAREQGFTLRGKHHEVYLGDPRRAKPEALKTIIRMPVSR